MPRLAAEDRVAAGGDVVDGEHGRVAGRDEVADGGPVVRAVADRHVVLERRARVDKEERDLAVRDGDLRRIEMEIGHRDLGRPRRLSGRAAATAAARGEERNRHEADGDGPHCWNSATLTYRMRNRKIQTMSTKCQ